LAGSAAAAQESYWYRPTRQPTCHRCTAPLVRHWLSLHHAVPERHDRRWVILQPAGPDPAVQPCSVKTRSYDGSYLPPLSLLREFYTTHSSAHPQAATRLGNVGRLRHLLVTTGLDSSGHPAGQHLPTALRELLFFVLDEAVTHISECPAKLIAGIIVACYRRIVASQNTLSFLDPSPRPQQRCLARKHQSATRTASSLLVTSR